MTLHGTIVNGTIVFDAEQTLPEGARVSVTIQAEPGAWEKSPGQSPPQAASPLGETLLRHAGTVNNLPEDMAEQHDHYIHGTPRR